MKTLIEQLLAFPVRRFLVPMLSLIAAAAPLALTPIAQAQTAGRLLFLNSSNGAYQVGGVDIGGYYHESTSGTEPKLAGANTVVANNIAILAYNQNTGYSEFAVIDGFGHVAFKPQQFGAGYGSITGIGGNFLFYNGNTNEDGTGALVTLNQSGTYNTEPWASGLSPWSIIVQSDNYLNFYNMSTGLFDQATISVPLNEDLYQAPTSVVTLASGYGVIGAVNDNLILYNTTTGAYNVLGLYFAGTGNLSPESRSKGTLAKYYDVILPVGGQVLFYGYGTGNAQTGYLTPTGALVPESNSNLPLYTQMVVDGAYVVGYNALNGKLDVYSLSPAGALNIYSSSVIATGYSLTVTKS